MSKPKRPAIYARISHDPEQTRAGVDRQLQACHEAAESRGWPRPSEYVDNDRSAYRRAARPQWEALLADIASGHVDGVIVWHGDRLTRQPREFERFLDACEAAGIQENYVTATGQANLSTPDGVFTARLMANVANFESAHKSARVKAARRSEAARGIPQRGGLRPFGYLPDKRTPHPAEAPIFQELARRHIAGESSSALVRWLIENDIPTVGGGRWTYGRVTTMLANPRYANLRRHNGDIVGPGDWEALISETDHRIIAAKKDANRIGGRRQPRTYLLTGMVFCGRCGAALTTARDHRRVRRYVCPSRPDPSSCGGISITADQLERFVAQVVLYRLDTEELADGLATTKTADEGRDAEIIADARAELALLSEAYNARELTVREWVDAKKGHEVALDAAQRRMAAAGQYRSAAAFLGLGQQLAETWTDLDLGQQRAIVEAVIHRVDIKPVGRGIKVPITERAQVSYRA